MASFTELQEYRCHKIVRAAPIIKINLLPSGAYEVHLRLGDGRIEAFEVPQSVFQRSFPQPQDYLVHYEDGYLSWSPKVTFESGYSRYQPPTPAPETPPSQQRPPPLTRAGQMTPPRRMPEPPPDIVIGGMTTIEEMAKLGTGETRLPRTMEEMTGAPVVPKTKD